MRPYDSGSLIKDTATFVEEEDKEGGSSDNVQVNCKMELNQDFLKASGITDLMKSITEK